jgi:hypothetical protein
LKESLEKCWRCLYIHRDGRPCKPVSFTNHQLAFHASLFPSFHSTSPRPLPLSPSLPISPYLSLSSSFPLSLSPSLGLPSNPPPPNPFSPLCFVSTFLPPSLPPSLHHPPSFTPSVPTTWSLCGGITASARTFRGHPARHPHCRLRSSWQQSTHSSPRALRRTTSHIEGGW